ncbi:D-2-hydroxyacid dehydrogenase [Lentibacillus sediminis]|uniref:D-2-hydroxyacid dehydrogenase n=1 Tax=Lentibacillus sediminis TaxID=1940529 RepID=UPI000C1C4395|nr:D-2-hydroxyacid dehydrogenase [Lentibacillus sediminis]
MILFTAKISAKHHETLRANHSDQEFIFAENRDEVKEHLPQAEIVVTFGEDLQGADIEEAKQLKWIMVVSAGLDQMPFEEIEKKGILVTNVRGIHRVPMAEYAISMLLQVCRQAKVLIQNEKQHDWNPRVKMQEITGKTMLIAGPGAIGQEVARLAKAFRIKTVGVSKSGRVVEYFDENHTTDDLENVLPEADMVVSVLPSTEETRGLFTEKHFNLLPDNAIFLNMGRGDVVKSEVLLEAIRQGEIAHAVLDVFEEEPLPADHPFWQEENITITPHISGQSAHYIPRALEIFEHNLKVYQTDQGDHINLIDVRRGY